MHQRQQFLPQRQHHLRRQQRLRQFPEAYLINGDRKIVDYLLDKGIDMTLRQPSNQWTALTYAAVAVVGRAGALL